MKYKLLETNIDIVIDKIPGFWDTLKYQIGYSETNCCEPQSMIEFVTSEYLTQPGGIYSIYNLRWSCI